MTIRIHVTVRDRRTDRVVVDAETAFPTRTAFTDAMNFAHRAAAHVARADRHVSAVRA